MTKEEEAAEEYVKCGAARLHSMQPNIMRCSFLDGIKWARENPTKIIMPTNLYAAAEDLEALGRSHDLLKNRVYKLERTLEDTAQTIRMGIE